MRTVPATRTLVLGGIRSGKSAVAERLVTAASASPGDVVTYIATGPISDDPDWLARIAAHRRRRPAQWQTVESTDLPAALSALAGPAMVDCLGTWLTAQLDTAAAWEAPRSAWEPAVAERVTALTAAVEQHAHPLVLVSNEVGLSVVPDNRAARIFADWLGLTNQRLAEVCEVVDLVVAGHVVPVKRP